jgi:hypothetical protein
VKPLAPKLPLAMPPDGWPEFDFDWPDVDDPEDNMRALYAAVYAYAIATVANDRKKRQDVTVEEAMRLAIQAGFLITKFSKASGGGFQEEHEVMALIRLARQ